MLRYALCQWFRTGGVGQLGEVFEGAREGGVLCIGRPRSPLRGACPEAWRAVGEGVCSLQAGGVVAVGAVRS